MKKDWDAYFIKMSKLVATKSKDRSTQVGAVIVGTDNEVLSIGFNGFPRGVDDHVECRHERPAKYMFVCHAETNAIYNAARIGVKLKGSRMYMNFDPTPCCDCTKGVIQAGIVEIIGPNIPFPGKGDMWVESLRVADEMLLEAGVRRVTVEVDSDS